MGFSFLGKSEGGQTGVRMWNEEVTLGQQSVYFILSLACFLEWLEGGVLCWFRQLVSQRLET
jgi:hypothetical protein